MSGNLKQVRDFTVHGDEIIGKGQQGSIFKATRDDEVFACKVIDRRRLGSYGEYQVENEVTNLKLLRDTQGILRILDYKKSSRAWYIVTEYCNGGDLSLLLKHRGGGLTDIECQAIMKQLVPAIEAMHTAGVAHRDLKLANILLHFKDPEV
jgi:serine/threonine protein kinase